MLELFTLLCIGLSSIFELSEFHVEWMQTVILIPSNFKIEMIEGILFSILQTTTATDTVVERAAAARAARV